MTRDLEATPVGKVWKGSQEGARVLLPFEKGEVGKGESRGD